MPAETQRERAEQITSRTPMGRFGEPDEIAEMVVWLCSERASYVTGAAYAIDGVMDGDLKPASLWRKMIATRNASQCMGRRQRKTRHVSGREIASCRTIAH
jgi:hypothetical protein